MPATAPLLIVGLDAGDPDRILEWARTGDLPVLASMLEGGTSAGVFSAESVSAHGIWTTLFSGRSIAEHGGYARRTIRPGSYELEPVPLGGDASRPFWSGLDPNAEILVVDAPETPMVRELGGRQLAHWGDHPTSRAPVAEPPELVEEVRRLVGPPIPSDERQRGGRWRDRRVLPNLLQRVERKGRLCRELLSQRAARVVVVGFGDSHAAGHRYGKYVDDGGPLADALRDVYRALDREIGRIVEAFDVPPNVFVLANSGIRDGQPLGTLMDDLCRALGYKHAIDDAPPKRIPILTLKRGAHEQARFLGDTDWSRTEVFAIPASYTGYLRVNLAGREPEGTVAPGEEYDLLLDRLVDDLEQLTDVDTGESVVESITRTADVFGSGPPERLPDLFVVCRPCSLPQRIEHPRATLTRRRGGDLRDNNHSRRGLVIAAGPAIAAHGSVGDLAARDFAPLFLAAGGHPLADDAVRAGLEAFLR